MSEDKNTPNSEFDFDAWLADGERVTHTVRLFSRIDLFDEIEKLQDQRTASEQIPVDDESLSGDENPNTEIDQQIEELEMRLWESKLEFSVVGRTTQEVDEIRERVLVDCKDEIDAAATKGRNEAKNTAKRGGVTVAADINALVRLGGMEWSNKLINQEINLRVVSASAHAVAPDGTKYPVTVERARQIQAKLGDQQFDLLVDAAFAAKNDMPKVTVPKS